MLPPGLVTQPLVQPAERVIDQRRAPQLCVGSDIGRFARRCSARRPAQWSNSTASGYGPARTWSWARSSSTWTSQVIGWPANRAPTNPRVHRQGVVQGLLGFGLAVQLAEHGRPQVAGAEVVAVAAQAAVQVLQGRGKSPLAAVHFRQRMVAGAAPCLAPGRLIEGGIGLAEEVVHGGVRRTSGVDLIAKAEAQVVEGLAVVRVGVVAGEPLDRPAETSLGRRNSPAAEMPQPQGVVGRASGRRGQRSRE